MMLLRTVLDQTKVVNFIAYWSWFYGPQGPF